MEETTPSTQQPVDAGEGEPAVGHTVLGDTAQVTLRGDLTETARRPLVRIVTDLLLENHALHRIELCLAETTFMNSAGLAVLVQLQKLVQPRGIDLVLVDPPSAVIRPLQLSGLWHRFSVVPGEGGTDEAAVPPRHPDPASPGREPGRSS